MRLGDIILLDKPVPDFAVIYIIKDGDEVLYVGSSYDPRQRLLYHCLMSLPTGDTSLTYPIQRSKPYCYDWEVEFIDLPEDVRAADYWMREKECELIKQLKPKYNSNLQ